MKTTMLYHNVINRLRASWCRTSYALCLTSLALTACGDFLDQLPDERTHIDTEEKVRQLLVTSYPRSNYGWVGEVSSDNFMDNNAPHLPASPTADPIVTRFNLSAYGKEDDELFRFEQCVSSEAQDTPSYLWSDLYSSIFSTNYALEAIDEIAQRNDGVMSDRLKHLRSEALLLRAYCHFILVNVFSQAYKNDELSKNDIGIPYVTNTSKDFQQNYSRGNVADVYAKIQEDLEEGLKNVSDAELKVVKYHFNVAAAHAFAARFYLFYKKWDKVIEHADVVLGTDYNTLLTKLMDYSGMDACTAMSDYGVIYQSADAPNNIMLLNTMSWIRRRGLGYRYAMNSTAVRDVFYHQTDYNGRYYGYPAAFNGGYTFWLGSTRPYGYIACKIYEEFEYTNALKTSGYGHVIRREFTGNMLLLERAEARIMLKQYDDALQDMVYLNKSLQSFSETTLAEVRSVGARDIDMRDITGYFTPKEGQSLKPNCFRNWDFAQNMGTTIPAEATPYMNCLNELRRFEGCWDGFRFFDLKRWGIEYSHLWGPNSEELRLTWDDPRRAVEIPQSAMEAGMESSRPVQKEPATDGELGAAPAEYSK